MNNNITLFIISLALISCKGKKESVAFTGAVIPAEMQIVNNGNVTFDQYFTDKTMRLDYFHSGKATEEHFAADRVVSDGIWSGSKKTLLDELNLGLYFFEVIDKESKILLYSMGFASVFGEWQTIPDAAEKFRDKVGAFEGAGYLAKGLFRPQVDCIMFSRHLVFCKVCGRSIENVIDHYVK